MSSVELHLKKASQLSPVGDVPFPIGTTQIAHRYLGLGHPAEKGWQGAHTAQFLLGLEEFLKQLGLLCGLVLDFQYPRRGLGSQRAEEECGESSQQFPVMVKCCEEFQPSEHIQGFVAVKNTAETFAGRLAGNAHGMQCLANVSELPVIGGEYADVSWDQTPWLSGVSVGDEHGIAEQSRDFLSGQGG